MVWCMLHYSNVATRINLCVSTEVFVESINDFTIDPRALGPQGHGKIKAILTDPAGSRTELPITSNKDGTLAGIYTPLQKGWL